MPLPLLAWAASRLIDPAPLRHGVLAAGVAPSGVAAVAIVGLGGGEAALTAAPKPPDLTSIDPNDVTLRDPEPAATLDDNLAHALRVPDMSDRLLVQQRDDLGEGSLDGLDVDAGARGRE